MDQSELKQHIKQLIIQECDKEDEFDWQELEDAELLFGGDSRIQMDSLDALQLSLALQQRYGVRIEGARDGRRVLASVNSIVEFILQAR